MHDRTWRIRRINIGNSIILYGKKKINTTRIKN